MPNYVVKNRSSGNRMVQIEATGKGKARQVSLMPGEERTLPLSPRMAARYAQAAARNEKYLKITPADDEARGAISGVDTTAVVGDNTSDPRDAPEGGPSGTGAGQTAAQELLSRADSISPEELRTEAKMVLGSRWPRRGGNDLTRDQIKELLAAPAQEE